MTREDLDRLAALVAASEQQSPAPWSRVGTSVYDAHNDFQVLDLDGECIAADVNAIIALRNAAPDLLALASEALEARDTYRVEWCGGRRGGVVILAVTIDARSMSTDHRATPTRTKSGARIKVHSKPYRAWLRYVRLALLAARQRLRSWPLEWPDGYTVRVAVFVPDAHKRDLDNIVKPVLDAAKGVLWADDSAVRATEVVLGGVDREHPRIALLVLSGAHAADRAAEISDLAVMHAHQARSA